MTNLRNMLTPVSIQKNLDCNGGPCENAYSDMKSYGMSWGAEVSAYGWTGLNFAVSQEVQTGTVSNCQSMADQPETKTLCVWYRTAYT